jgi:signal transduction histidine kinase
MLLMLTGFKFNALRLNMLNNGLGLSSLLLIALWIKPWPEDRQHPVRYHLPKIALVLYYLTVLIMLGLSVLPSLGLLQGSMLSIYGVLLYGLISGFYMTSLLVVRSRQMERLRLEQANHLFLSREQLAVETRRRQDQSQLLNMLMHELKTPLSVIELALKDGSVTSKANGYVVRAIENMKSILNRCLQTERLVDRPFEIQNQRFDLARQLQQWVQDNKQAEGRIALQTLPAAPVEADLQCVQIIFSNLIENALRYGDPDEPVRIFLQEQSHADGRRGLCVRVINAPSRAGRPDADQVFAKYYRSPAAQRQSGTGLGLFLSHNLALQIGAELRHDSFDPLIAFELWLPT